jgi:polysaccharide biosynthesis/export protein
MLFAKHKGGGMMRKIFVLALLFSVVIVAAASYGSALADVQQALAAQQQASSQKDTRNDRINELVMKAAASAPRINVRNDYRIGPDDVIEMSVFEVDEMNRTVRVSAQGSIGLPLVGQVKAAGLTPAELEHELALRLDKYYVDPVVSIFIKEYRSAKIGVMGAVRKPQVFAVTDPKRLLEMLSLAEGLSPEAGSTAYIMRDTEGENGTPQSETIMVDLDSLLEQGNLALNMVLQSGDVVHVPKGGTVYVDGAVEKPGAYPITPKTTLVKVLAMAGGLKYEGRDSGIKVYRDNGKGSKDMLTVDYDAVNSGESADILLKEGDIVIVPSIASHKFCARFWQFDISKYGIYTDL